MREWYTLEYSRYGIHTVGRYSDIEEVKSKLLEFDKAKAQKKKRYENIHVYKTVELDIEEIRNA